MTHWKNASVSYMFLGLHIMAMQQTRSYTNGDVSPAACGFFIFFFPSSIVKNKCILYIIYIYILYTYIYIYYKYISLYIYMK